MGINYSGKERITRKEKPPDCDWRYILECVSSYCVEFSGLCFNELSLP